ncbi:putative antiviral protein [Clavispora lusitaniae]|uniref:Antiviral protein n=1 Tax=Clavispora lusitaniae TaxID=36911 RepID=A0ACD0WJE4_CLALS|nr:putative antiviral protein [Clavispora lusitaniae]QFZ33171.1 putative antiviral protein [Clavispora lusitaniae]QFZ38842.1 putative antiviral protein [Clavispora lusitaniae]QFZ44524.1 putative antiviral protein [Clavispora lusitaniae]QFZ50201.1 putative antiviral protein [Clavispora lusitaniae]
MGKQYISTVSAALAHKSDISAVEITNKYTISVSCDGDVAFWDNKKDDVHTPSEHVVYKHIDKIGIHHVAVYETVPAGSTTRVTVLAFACFDGAVRIFYYTNDDLDTFTQLDLSDFTSLCWCPAFYKDPTSAQDFFVVTKADGSVAVHPLNVQESDGAVTVEIRPLAGSLHASNTATSFPNTLDVSSCDGLCAVGYISGDVVVYNLTSQKALFTFHSTDLQHKGKGSTAIPRALAFSPGGTLLAVSRDNQSAGSITLYDVKYGENVGSLTGPSHSSKATVGGFAHGGWVTGLSFNGDGSLLASCGFDRCVRVWNIESREREATVQLSVSDLDFEPEDSDDSVCSGVAFIKKGVRGGAGGDANEGLCVVSFDRGIRWYREAGGI